MNDFKPCPRKLTKLIYECRQCKQTFAIDLDEKEKEVGGHGQVSHFLKHKEKYKYEICNCSDKIIKTVSDGTVFQRRKGLAVLIGMSEDL